MSSEAKKARHAARRQVAAEEFRVAQMMAENAGLTLRALPSFDERGNSYGYQLRWPGEGPFPNAILNIYPGNCRIYGPKERRGPYIGLESPWTLRQVVAAATEKTLKPQIREGGANGDADKRRR